MLKTNRIMLLEFYKYQGTGNDFIVIDNREGVFDTKNIDLIQQLCNRKFGIGSDGLILIENHSEWDFDMVFYNPDGSQSFCGNGSRCAVTFAKNLGIITDFARFNSTDGYHEAKIDADGIVQLKMHDVSSIEIEKEFHFMNTGSPHYNAFVKNVKSVNIIEKGREIRYNERFKEIGTNVNFIEQLPEGIKVRTYERGVENETLSCGTGVTACVLSTAILNELKQGEIKVETLGGKLSVSFIQSVNRFENIWLKGPAELVFKGEIMI